jgi:hypothetical protein
VTALTDPPVPGVLGGLRLDPALAGATAELVASAAPFPFSPEPLRRPAALRERMAETCAAFVAGVDALHAAYRDDPAGLTALLRLPPHLAALRDVLPDGDWAVIARPDLLVAGDRTLLIDGNASSFAGLFPLSDLLARSQRELAAATGRPVPPAPEPTVPVLADLLWARTADPDGLVVLSYFAHERAGGFNWFDWYYRLLAWELRRCGVPARIATAEELAVTGGRVRLGGRRVGVVYRFWPVPAPGSPEWTVMDRLVGAARDGGTALFTDFRGELFAVKVVIALLSDERTRPLLGDALADRLQRALPWTRLLEERSTAAGGETVDLVPHVLRRRETTVLKPASGRGGDRVHIGPECTPAEWAAAVAAAVADPEAWLVQELVLADPSRVAVAAPDGTVDRRLLPVVYGAFLLDRQLVGAIGRHGMGGPGRLNINGHLGVIPTPVTWTADQPSTGDFPERR